MKVLKGISLFFLYPATMFVLGFWGGVKTEHFFYPGEAREAQQAQQLKSEAVSAKPSDGQGERKAVTGDGLDDSGTEPKMAQGGIGNGAGQDMGDIGKNTASEANPVAARGETLSVDTEYVLLETDILHDTEVETTWRLPGQYIGMDREQFLVAIENYSSYPPLSEMERGFVSAEVVSFARERVVVRKNYHSVQVDEGFYLAVADHEVVVYLEDRETLYMSTGILLEELPEEVQLQIMQMLYLEDEGALYSFLETYTS